MKLNLGCGKDVRIGYHNFDIDKSLNNDNICHQDVSNLNHISDGVVDEICALHIIEYFTPTEFQEIIKNWASKLKIGGKIYIKSWDYKLIFNHAVYNRLEIININNMLFGETTKQRGVYDMTNVVHLLETVGFRIIEKIYRDYEFLITAEKVKDVKNNG